MPNMSGLDEASESFREHGIDAVVEGMKEAIERSIVDGLQGDAMESVGGMGDVNDGNEGHGFNGDGGIDQRLKKMGYDNAVAAAE